MKPSVTFSFFIMFSWIASFLLLMAFTSASAFPLRGTLNSLFLGTMFLHFIIYFYFAAFKLIRHVIVKVLNKYNEHAKSVTKKKLKQ